jgi:hypothetical protein
MIPFDVFRISTSKWNDKLEIQNKQRRSVDNHIDREIVTHYSQENIFRFHYSIFYYFHISKLCKQ